MKKKRVLMVVDDNREVVNKLANLVQLLQAACPFSFAYSYREGVRLSENEEVNLAMLDICVPEKEEVDILRMVKESRIPATFIIDISDNDTEGQEEEFKTDLDQWLEEKMKNDEQ